MSTIKVTNVHDTSNNVSLVTDNAGIKTDKLTGNSTASSISVVGEGGSTTTNLQQGLAKMFCTFNGTSTVAISDSFNASGLTDRGTGLYTVTIGNDMANGNHTPTTSCKKEDGTDDGNLMSVAGSGTGYTNVATEVRVLTRRVEATDLLDSPHVYVVVHGDLA